MAKKLYLAIRKRNESVISMKVASENSKNGETNIGGEKRQWL
jgi:hypothetical protein